MNLDLMSLAAPAPADPAAAGASPSTGATAGNGAAFAEMAAAMLADLTRGGVGAAALPGVTADNGTVPNVPSVIASTTPQVLPADVGVSATDPGSAPAVEPETSEPRPVKGAPFGGPGVALNAVLAAAVGTSPVPIPADHSAPSSAGGANPPAIGAGVPGATPEVAGAGAPVRSEIGGDAAEAVASSSSPSSGGSPPAAPAVPAVAPAAAGAATTIEAIDVSAEVPPRGARPATGAAQTTASQSPAESLVAVADAPMTTTGSHAAAAQAAMTTRRAPKASLPEVGEAAGAEPVTSEATIAPDEPSVATKQLASNGVDPAQHGASRATAAGDVVGAKAAAATTAPTTSPDGVPFVDPNVARIGGAVRTLHLDGGRAVSLDLTPVELGRVHVELVSRDGRVEVHLQADRSAAADVLRGASTHLRHALESDGLTLDRIGVGVTGDGGRSGGSPHRGDEPSNASSSWSRSTPQVPGAEPRRLGTTFRTDRQHRQAGGLDVDL